MAKKNIEDMPLVELEMLLEHIKRVRQAEKKKAQDEIRRRNLICQLRAMGITEVEYE